MWSYSYFGFINFKSQKQRARDYRTCMLIISYASLASNSTLIMAHIILGRLLWYDDWHVEKHVNGEFMWQNKRENATISRCFGCKIEKHTSWIQALSINLSCKMAQKRDKSSIVQCCKILYKVMPFLRPLYYSIPNLEAHQSLHVPTFLSLTHSPWTMQSLTWHYFPKVLLW